MQLTYKQSIELAQEQALNLQMTREKEAAAEQQISRTDQLKKIEAEQEAMAVSHGMDLSSGTFKSLSAQSYDNFAKATDIGNMNLKMEEERINSQILAGRERLKQQQSSDFFGMIGNISHMALSTGSLIASGSSYGSTKNTAGSNNIPMPQQQTYSQLDDQDWAYHNWLKSEQTY